MLREITVVACLSLLVGSAEVLAQNPAENDLLEHGQGLILDTEEDLAGIPRTPEYRAFLPDRIDLSNRFPALVTKVGRTPVSAGPLDTPREPIT